MIVQGLERRNWIPRANRQRPNILSIDLFSTISSLRIFLPTIHQQRGVVEQPQLSSPGFCSTQFAAIPLGHPLMLSLSPFAISHLARDCQERVSLISIHLAIHNAHALVTIVHTMHLAKENHVLELLQQQAAPVGQRLRGDAALLRESTLATILPLGINGLVTDWRRLLLVARKNDVTTAESNAANTAILLRGRAETFRQSVINSTQHFLAYHADLVFHQNLRSLQLLHHLLHAAAAPGPRTEFPDTDAVLAVDGARTILHVKTSAARGRRQDSHAINICGFTPRVFHMLAPRTNNGPNAPRLPRTRRTKQKQSQRVILAEISAFPDARSALQSMPVHDVESKLLPRIEIGTSHTIARNDTPRAGKRRPARHQPRVLGPGHNRRPLATNRVNRRFPSHARNIQLARTAHNDIWAGARRPSSGSLLRRVEVSPMVTRAVVGRVVAAGRGSLVVRHVNHVSLSIHTENNVSNGINIVIDGAAIGKFRACGTSRKVLFAIVGLVSGRFRLRRKLLFQLHRPQHPTHQHTIRTHSLLGIRRIIPRIVQPKVETRPKRIPALILINNPRRHPCSEHGVDQHLDQSEVPTAIELHDQIPNTQITTHRILEDRLAVADGLGSRQNQKIGSGFRDGCVSATRSHQPPKRNHTHPRIIPVPRVRHVGTTRSKTRRHHQTHRTAGQSHPLACHIILVVKLVQRSVAELQI